MRLLLDSNVLLWTIFEPQRLSTDVATRLIDPDNDVRVSAVSIAELRIKQTIGKLDLPDDFVDLIVETDFAELAFSVDHANRLNMLDLHHRDPFDRMLVAQAIEERMTLVTSDRLLDRYPVSTMIN